MRWIASTLLALTTLASCVGEKEYIVNTKRDTNFSAGYELKLGQQLDRTHGFRLGLETIVQSETRKTVPVEQPKQESAPEQFAYYRPVQEEAPPKEEVYSGMDICTAHDSTLAVMFSENGDDILLKLEEFMGLGYYGSCRSDGSNYIDGRLKLGMEFGTAGKPKGDVTLTVGIGPRLRLGWWFLMAMFDIRAPINRTDDDIYGGSFTTGISF